MSLRPLFRPQLPRYSVYALCAAATLASCSVDERGLTYQLSSLGSSPTQEAGAPNDINSPADGGNSAAAGSGDGGDGVGDNAGGTGNGAGSGNSDSGADSGASAGSMTGGGTHSGTGGGSNAGGSNAGGSNAGGSAGSPTGGSTNVGGTSAGSSSAGSAGSGGGGGAPFISPCGDLNHDLVDDCEENLLHNSRFNKAIDLWDAEQTSTQHWDPTDASGAAQSGALRVVNTNLIADLGGTTALGSHQCVKASMGQHFDVASKAFIKSGQGSGKASISVLMFSGDACDGTFIDGKQLDAVADADAWRVIQGQIEVSAGSRSMSVRLVAVKPLAQASFEVLFDDVLVSEKK